MINWIQTCNEYAVINSTLNEFIIFFISSNIKKSYNYIYLILISLCDLLYIYNNIEFFLISKNFDNDMEIN